jgi:DNA-directed RNA polymerase subunit RPC12/RpoP
MRRKQKVLYHCSRCSRRLRPQRWVYSHFTGSRYCWPGEGCHR